MNDQLHLSRNIKFSSARRLLSSFFGSARAYQRTIRYGFLLALAFLALTSSAAPQPTISRGEQLLPIMTLPDYPAIVQDKEAPEGLTGGQEVHATSAILEGTWSLFAVHTGKSGGWKHSGTITITKYEGSDGLQVKFDMGGSDPAAKNEVKFTGNAVILYRAITKADGTDPDFPDQFDTSQTWRGRLLEDANGLKIEGRISGGGTPWNIRHGNAVTFLARKL